jgi:hypothetical protein
MPPHVNDYDSLVAFYQRKTFKDGLVRKPRNTVI